MEDILSRLANEEDGFTERKPEGAGTADFKRTLVAFANSAPEDRPAVLFIGVSDDGGILGIDNPDSLQKTIRGICEKDCHPPINFQCQVLNKEGKDILAVIVPRSENRPHFAGPAYVRIGSESVVASEQMFDELITSRHSKPRQILEWKREGKLVTVVVQGKRLGEVKPLRDPMYHATHECRIEECTVHDVRLYDTSRSQYCREPLENVTPSWDEERYRPMLIIQEH